MLKCLMKNKIKEEVKNTAVKNSKRGMMYVGAILAGAGVYFSYKMMKKRREVDYLDDSTHDVDNYKDYDGKILENEPKNASVEENKSESKDNEKDELEKKVEEFNSRRISSENCTDPSQEEMRHFLANMNKDNNNINIDYNGFVEGHYEDYDHHEEDISKK